MHRVLFRRPIWKGPRFWAQPLQVLAMKKWEELDGVTDLSNIINFDMIMMTLFKTSVTF